MVKMITPIVKNNPKRKRRNIILVGTEGKNKTEQLYFREIERKQNKYHFIFVTGNETDPVKITYNTVRCRKKENLNLNVGDIAVSIFDLDSDKSKETQLEKAKQIADEGKVVVITSNPCFEVWYLEHFKFTTKQFSNSDSVIKQLRLHIPEYTKNYCNFNKLYPNTKEAIKNCKKLEDYHASLGTEKIAEFNNPRSDIYKIIEILFQRDK